MRRIDPMLRRSRAAREPIDAAYGTTLGTLAGAALWLAAIVAWLAS